MHVVSTRRRAALAGAMATAAALDSGSALARSADRAWTYLSNGLGHRCIYQSDFLHLIRDKSRSGHLAGAAAHSGWTLSSPQRVLSQCRRRRHIAGTKNSAARTSIASRWQMAPFAKQGRASRCRPVSCCLTGTAGCVSHTTCVTIGAMTKRQR